MSLLTVIQKVCNRVGVAAPTTASGSTDQQVVQMIALANEEGEELAERYTWQSLQLEATHTTLAAELQGVMTTIAPGFKYILNDTIWNRTQQRPMYGSLTPDNWQVLKSSSINGPYQEYRVKGGSLYLIPAPAAGHTIAFEYMSKNWCQSSALTGQDAWSLDADTGILDENIMIAGVIWRWRNAKGLDYTEEFRNYEVRVANAMNRDAGKSSIMMDGSPSTRQPGIIVPTGNWPL